MFSNIIYKHLPGDWTIDQKHSVDYKMITIPSYTSEYDDLEEKVNGYDSSYISSIRKIVRIENPYLYTQFLLKKEEYRHRGIDANIVELFHDTGESKISSIVSNNLDWRLTTRAKFGKGVCFASSPSYANRYSTWDNGTYRAMIIADVLVGNKSRGGYSTVLPETGSDTTVGNGEKINKIINGQ